MAAALAGSRKLRQEYAALLCQRGGSPRQSVLSAVAAEPLDLGAVEADGMKAPVGRGADDPKPPVGAAGCADMAGFFPGAAACFGAAGSSPPDSGAMFPKAETGVSEPAFAVAATTGATVLVLRTGFTGAGSAAVTTSSVRFFESGGTISGAILAVFVAGAATLSWL